MNQAFYLSGRRRRQLAVLPLVALLSVSACNETDPLAESSLSDPTEVSTSDQPVADGVTPQLSVSYSGRVFGPTDLWASYQDVKWGPAPFSGSKNFSGPSGLVKQISAARTMKQRLVLTMTGGPVKNYLTNGKFDLAKWKKVMNTFNTSTLRNAVASAVSDGTIVGNSLIDEPETPKWGGNVTKSTIDQMAVYAKNIFPTLPQGFVTGPPGYRWRASERFYKLDFVVYGYKWWITQGDVNTWRSAVLRQATLDGVTPAFTLNILDGGKNDKDGTYNCTGSGQYGKGTYYPNCSMTPSQIRDWGRALVGYGCMTLMWRYNGTYFSKSGIPDAFKDVASAARSLSAKSCKRA